MQINSRSCKQALRMQSNTSTNLISTNCKSRAFAACKTLRHVPLCTSLLFTSDCHTAGAQQPITADLSGDARIPLLFPFLSLVALSNRRGSKSTLARPTRLFSDPVSYRAFLLSRARTKEVEEREGKRRAAVENPSASSWGRLWAK